jgi:hypothetical protein
MTAKIESLWKTYEAINELIRFADTKATAILAINGVIAGFFFSNIGSIQTVLKQSPVAIAPFVTATILVMISICLSAYCIMPRLGSKKNCLIFFCDIARDYETAIDYETVWKRAARAKIETELTHQIWENSKIASKKYDLVWCSIFFFVSSLFASTVFTIAVLWK